MIQNRKSKKEVQLLLIAFIILGLFTSTIKIFEFYNIKIISSTTTNIYEHSLKVSNAALTIKLNVYRIQRDMKDIILSLSAKEISTLINQINHHEKRVYKNFDIIEHNILGNDGLKLEKETRKLFDAWKPIRDEIIFLMKNEKRDNAIAITQRKGAKHVLKLEAATVALNTYAQQKAIGFKNQSESSFKILKTIHLIITLLFFFLFIFIGYYIIHRLSMHINKNEHLNNVLSIIRNVNQLIVREKNPQSLIQESCNILTSTNVYFNAWIVTYDDNNDIEHVANTYNEKKFASFKEKLSKAWLPYCINQTILNNSSYTFVKNTQNYCEDCPFKDEYQNQCAFNIALKYKEKIYGYLTLIISPKYTNDKEELALLIEVAEDIAYALYNLKIEQCLIEQEERYRYALEATTDGIWDIDIVTNKVYFSPRWKKILGYNDDELTNTFETWEKRIHPDDLEQTLFDMEVSQNSTSGRYKNVHRLKHKNGHWVWIDVRGQTIFDEKNKAIRMIGSHTDVTQEKIAEQEILHLKDLYNNIIDSVDNLIFVTDTNSVFITCNKAFERFLGASKDEIIGKSDHDFYTKEQSELFTYNDKKIFESNKTTSTFEWVTDTNGKMYYLLTTKSPLLDINGNVLGIVGNSTDFTERQHLYDKIIKINNKLTNISENIPGIIFTYQLFPSGRSCFPYASEHMYEIYGVTANDVKEDAKKVFDVLHPEDIDRITKTIQTSAKELTLWKEEYRVIHPDKGTIWLRGMSKPEKQPDESILWSGYIYDITENKIAELQFKTIFDEAPNPIMLHNEEGKVLMINKVWKKLTGYSFEDIDTIEKWTKNAYGEQISIVKNYIDELYNLNTAVNEGEYPIITKNGDIITWQFSSAPLGKIDNKRTIISSAMDVTELKNKDKILIAQSRLAAMGEMISMIAHQWRQPLAVIAMNANNMILDIALDQLDKKGVREYANNIQLQTENLSKTIDDFRNFFKPDKSTSKIKMQDILEDTYEIVKDSLKNHHIILKTSYQSESKVNAYPRELMQVFVNIMNNSKDALILKKCKDPQIDINVIEDNDYVITTICDNGGGIDETIISKIFDPYFTTKDKNTGTGLGLYMSKMIIDSHLHGKLEASNKNAGACFTIKLLK